MLNMTQRKRFAYKNEKWNFAKYYMSNVDLMS